MCLAGFAGKLYVAATVDVHADALAGEVVCLDVATAVTLTSNANAVQIMFLFFIVLYSYCFVSAKLMTDYTGVESGNKFKYCSKSACRINMAVARSSFRPW